MEAPTLVLDTPLDYFLDWLRSYVAERRPTTIQSEQGTALTLGALDWLPDKGSNSGWAHIGATETRLIADTGKHRLVNAEDAAAFNLRALAPRRTSVRAFLKHPAAEPYLSTLLAALVEVYPEAVPERAESLSSRQGEDVPTRAPKKRGRPLGTGKLRGATLERIQQTFWARHDAQKPPTKGEIASALVDPAGVDVSARALDHRIDRLRKDRGFSNKLPWPPNRDFDTWLAHGANHSVITPPE